MKRILVCGDRNWSDGLMIRRMIFGFSATRILLIEGCAPGADHFAHEFEADGVEHKHFPANWNQYGNAAGPIRNREMLKVGKPDVVLAFHDDLKHSKGTKDMVKIAKEAGVPVYVVSHG